MKFVCLDICSIYTLDASKLKANLRLKLEVQKIKIIKSQSVEI